MFENLRKKFTKRKLFGLLAAVSAIVFVLLPFPAAKLHIRIYFDEIEGDSFALYYSVDEDQTLSEENCIVAGVDYEKKCVDFCLDSSLEGRVTALRLDFPNREQLVSVKTITVSSAGALKHEFNPCHFFDEKNIVQMNDIPDWNLVKPTAHAYFRTLDGDPWLVLSDNACGQIMGYYSHFRLTRALFCLFAAACFVLARRRLFADELLPAFQSGT